MIPPTTGVSTVPCPNGGALVATTEPATDILAWQPPTRRASSARPVDLPPTPSFPAVELHDMDCKTVRSLLVPYLDGELAPAQVAWLEAHRELCEGCRSAAAVLAAQSVQLQALVPPPLPTRLSDALWEPMDRRLASALDQLEAQVSPTEPTTPVGSMGPRLPVQLSRKAVFAYAAVLGMAMAFGVWRHDAAERAEARIQALRMELERVERLQASPRPVRGSSEGYQTVSYHQDRGHF